MKERSATSKKLHQLWTPIKVNFDVCPKISSHDGLQICYNINFGWYRSQSFPDRQQSNRNFLLTRLNFLTTINLLFLRTIGVLLSKQWNFHTNITGMHLNSGAKNRKCTFLCTDIFSGRLYFLKFTLRKVKVTLSKVNF